MDSNITLYTLQKQIEKRLATVASEEACQQARLILCEALELDLLEIIAHRGRVLTADEIAKTERMVKRREEGEPLQYIFGTWEFMGLEFFVDSRVLIPRQDTEILVEKALFITREIKAKTALDMCCGSGCIGVSLMVYGGLTVDFADISRDCLDMAEKNAEKNSRNARSVIESDLFNSVTERYDIITINPPYLTKSDMDNLQREVQFEPALALYGGEDGLDFYRRISREYKKHLNPNGALLMEFGEGQGSDIREIFGGGELVRDLCGKERVLVVRL